MAEKENGVGGENEIVGTCRMFCKCCNKPGRHTIISCRNDNGRCRVIVECSVCGPRSKHTTLLNRKATSCGEKRKKRCLQRDSSQNATKPEPKKVGGWFGWFFRLFGR